MAFECPDPATIGFVRAAADLRLKQYFAVKLDEGTDGWQVAAAGNHHSVGVLQNAPNTGEAATVQVLGCTKAVAGAAITKYAPLSLNASGKFITATDATHVVGTALEAAGADGDIIAVWLRYAGEFEVLSPA